MKNQILNTKNFPSPIKTENAILLKEFPTPSVLIPTAEFSDKWGVEFNGESGKNAVAIGSITEQAGPNDSISIYGVGFENAEIYALGLIDRKSSIKQLEVTLQREDFVNAIIPANFQYGMYLIWIKGENGEISSPVRINAPKLTHLSSKKASSDTELRIYGKFLTTNNADGEDATSYVFLTNGNEYYKATVTEATPYRLKIKLPEGLEDGKTYKVWVHNGHGGDLGFSNALEVEYKENCDSFFKGNKHTVKVENGRATDKEILDAVSKAQDGDTIYLPQGIYAIGNQIKIEKSLKFEGESKENTIFVCLFAKEVCEQTSLVYGDLYSNYNGSPTAAFLVSVAPCEFNNITFTEYIEGVEFCEGIQKPESYHIDYAHGMFIRGVKTNDTGVQSSLRIDNCNFKVKRTYSHAKCIYTSFEQADKLHEKFEQKYEYYSRAKMASAPVWLATNNTEISNCVFETPKEIFMDGMHDGYIHNNTFIGTWVICGNSGPAAIHNNDSVNMDISENRIFGKDEIINPDGHIVTGALAFARTIVFQKGWEDSKNIFVMKNHISRVGELNYNSGEHILFEEQGIIYHGKVTLSNGGKTLKLNSLASSKWTGSGSSYRFVSYRTNDNGQIEKYPGTRQIVGQAVIISKGKGQGQWRTITKASSGCTITIDRAWDIMPDNTSEFVVAQAFTNSVVYGNKIEGPKIYYKNANSTTGVNAYATMLSGVIDRNNFSQMQTGVALNSHYDTKTYTYNGEETRVDFGFNMYSEMLIINNVIDNTRYGIWNFPTIKLNGMDNSTADPALKLELGVIIRGNTISNAKKLTGGADTNDTVTSALKKRGGVAIVVGRDYTESSLVLSTRYWISDVVIENNTITKPENAYLDISLSQSGTIIRNNSFDGKKNLTFDAVNVTHVQHTTGKKPQAPAYFK